MSQLSLFRTPSLTVSDLTRYLRQLLESDDVLQDIWVQGEVSNFSRPSSGHLYFTLKDSTASLRCVMWKQAVARQRYLPRDGEAVEAHGYISIYEIGGQYQLYADAIRPIGEGALYQEFLRLKNRLEAEGLFDPQRKRPIPRWPQRLGIVTSPTGAALRDVIHTLRRRYPLVEVILAPCPVQGEDALAGIQASLANLNAIIKPDVILLVRGGGSIEDLWAFNDENVARAIAASAAPVISGVGHETDFTIADFVADLRAPTPTAAAELSTPNQTDLRLAMDELVSALNRISYDAVTTRRWELADLRHRLALYSPLTRLQADRQRLSDWTHRARAATSHQINLARALLEGQALKLAALNPVAVLERGFALVTDRDGNPISRVSQAIPGDEIDIRVRDGSFGARVEGQE